MRSGIGWLASGYASFGLRKALMAGCFVILIRSNATYELM